MRKAFLTFIAVFFVGGVCFCVFHDWPAASFNAKLAAAVARGSGTVSLRQLVRKPWERVYIFDCYTAADEVSRALGFAYFDRNVDAIQLSEGESLLLFVSGQRVVFSVLHPRGQGDFYPDSVGRSFTPEEAVFTIVPRPADARLLLSPLRNAPPPSPARQRTDTGGGVRPRQSLLLTRFPFARFTAPS
jgi:hypothetical protein